MAGSRDQGMRHTMLECVVDTLLGKTEGEIELTDRTRTQTFLLRRCLREAVRRVFAPLGFREGSLMITKLLRGGRGRDLSGIALTVGNERE